jgi:hypothetical protein
MSLEDYYGQSVIGGMGSFVEIADETRPFAVAARRKLLNEVAGISSRRRPLAGGNLFVVPIVSSDEFRKP